jgi:HlyD family secretion protein
MTMTKSRMSKSIVWAGIALAVVGGAVWTLRPQPIPVRTATSGVGDLAVTVSGEGRTRVKDLYVVAAPVDGDLARVVVHPSDAVEVGAMVAEVRPAASRPLDPRTRAQASAAVTAARAAVARAEATEREAQAAQEHAESLLARTSQLAAKGAATTADAEHSGHEAQIRRGAAEAAGAAAREARAELARALATLSPQTSKGAATVPVASPGAGRILRVLRESAGPVAVGTPLVEVGDVGRMEVSADLLSNDAALVKPGARATITGWGGREVIAAHVRRIDPAAFTKVSALGLEEQRVHVLLDLDQAPPSGLGHDYRVDAAVEVWRGKDILRVPSTALFREGDRWALFVVRDGRARRVLVDAREGDGTWTAVRSGLQENEVVITQPSDQVTDGTRVVSLQ